MADVALEPASRRSHAELAAILTAGYEDYYTPFVVDETAFRFMTTVWDDDLDASRVAVVDGEPAGIAKLAIRGDRGWIAGIGVAVPHRGKGVGEALMNAVLAEARSPRPARGLARGARPERAGDPPLREARLRARSRARGVDARAAPARRACVPGTQSPRRAARAGARAHPPGADGARAVAARRRDDREPRGRRRPRERQRGHALPTYRRTDLAAPGRGRGTSPPPASCSRGSLRTRTTLAWMNGPAGDPFNRAISALGGSLEHRQHELVLAL